MIDRKQSLGLIQMQSANESQDNVNAYYKKSFFSGLQVMKQA